MISPPAQLQRLTAARFNGPQALYTEAVAMLRERPALPDDLADHAAVVKPLVWVDDPDRSKGLTRADGYDIWDFDDGPCLVFNSVVKGSFGTIEAAKDAAQADYEARILSAIPSPTADNSEGGASMSDAPERIWAFDHQHIGAITHGEWADCIRHGGGDEYVRADLHAAAIARAEAALAAAEEALRLSAVSHRVIAGMDLIGAPAVAYNAARDAEAALAKIAALKGGEA